MLDCSPSFRRLKASDFGKRSRHRWLKAKDLPEVRIEDGNVVFTSIPTMIIVRHGISKARHKYFTFLTNKGSEYLKAYLDRTLATGETLSLDFAIILVKFGYEETGLRAGSRCSGHLTTKTVTEEVRDAMRPRFIWRPYVLRVYFDT